MSQRRPTPQRISTMQIKMGLEKIKLAQMEVLKQLRRQNNQFHGQSENQNHRQNSLINADMTQNVTKQVSGQSLQSLKRQLIEQREKSIDNTSQLYKKMGQLQSEVTKRGQKQLQLKTEISKIKKQLLEKQLLCEQKVKQIKKINQIADSWHSELKDLESAYEQQKVNNRQWSQRYDRLQKKYSQVKQQCDDLKKRAQTEHKKKNDPSTANNAQTGAYDRRRSLQIEKIISGLRKMNQSHDRLYDRLKTFRNIEQKDMDVQQQYQNAFNRTISLIESLQKNVIRKNEIQESAILSNIVGKYQFEGSFREDIKKIQKQLYGSQDLAQQNIKLREQVKNLRQKVQDNQNDKKFLQNRVITLRNQLKQVKQKVFSIENMKFVDGLSINRQAQDQKTHSKIIQKLIEENKKLQSQVRQLKIQISVNTNKNNEQRDKLQGLQEIPEMQHRTSQSGSQKKNILSILREFQENQDPNDNEEIRQKVKLIIEMNNQVRKQNNALKKQVQLHLLEVQKLGFQKDQLESASKNEKTTISNLINENARLRQVLKKAQFERNQANNKIVQLSRKIQQFERNSKAKQKQHEGLLQNRTNEINMLRKQNENYFKQHRDLVKFKDDYSKLEASFITMSRNAKKIDVAVDHLWEIKETQYQNISVILNIINATKQTKL